MYNMSHQTRAIVQQLITTLKGNHIMQDVAMENY